METITGQTSSSQSVITRSSPATNAGGSCSTDFDEYPRGYAEWGGGGTITRAGWQIARGAQPGMGDAWLSEIGNSLYQSTDGFLQTYLFTSARNELP